MAKKKKKVEISAEELAEIEQLTDTLGPEIEMPEGLQEELSEVLAGAKSDVAQNVDSEAPVSELDTVREEARNNHELYLRALAEMDNLRKRNQRDKEEINKFGNENILREILPVIDNLERAVGHAIEQQEGTSLLEGVQMTLGQFTAAVQKFGVEELSSLGQLFDPTYHQAMGQIESTEVPVNHVVQEMQKGYLLNKRLLRPSLVMIAKAPEPAKENDENPEPAEDLG